MSFSYLPLWRMLSELNVNKMDFAKQIDISNTTLAKLSKNEPVNLSIIDKICNEYGCKLEDIVTHIPNTIYDDYDSLPPEGTIVVARDSSLLPELADYYVVIKHTNASDTVSPSLLLAPIVGTNHSSSLLNIKFRNVIINHDERNGHIAVGRAFWTNASYISGNFGMMPQDLIDVSKKLLSAAIQAKNQN